MKYSIVADKDRMEFIPTLVAQDLRALMYFENALYSLVDEATAEDPEPYHGGLWIFRIYENGAMAMVMDYDRKFKVTCASNYYSGEMSAEALSLACTMSICSRMSFTTTGKAQENLANNYHLLRAVAYGAYSEDETEIEGHPEACEIAAFLDQEKYYECIQHRQDGGKIALSILL